METFGDNPNASGQHMALAALILIGLTLNGTFKGDLKSKVLVPSLALILFAGIIATGSRSATAAFIIGCAAYMLPQWHSRRILTSVFLGSLGIGAVSYMTAKSSYFVERWQATYYDHEWAGRQNIYAAAFEMILEKPLHGWSPSGAFYELGRRVGRVEDGMEAGRDVHNLFLDLFITVGVVGASPFLLGLFGCLGAAWKARSGTFGMAPLSLIAANLIASMSHTNLTWKAQWFVLALTCAAVPAILARSAKASTTMVMQRIARPSGNRFQENDNLGR
jgi:O-antigen ligase